MANLINKNTLTSFHHPYVLSQYFHNSVLTSKSRCARLQNEVNILRPSRLEVETLKNVATGYNQMPPDYVIIIIFGAALYYYVHTSADRPLISQIFDDCRQQCVSSTHSNVSGLSGLQSTSRSPTSSNPDPAQACRCSSCPCAFIRNVIAPVAEMYTLIIGTMMQLYNSVKESVEEIQAHVSNVLNCAASCQRQPQGTGPLSRSEAVESRAGQSDARWKMGADIFRIPETSKGAEPSNVAELRALSEAERKIANWNGFLKCVCPKQSGTAMLGPSTVGAKENFLHERKPVKADGEDKIPQAPSKLVLLPKKSLQKLHQLLPKDKSKEQSDEPQSVGTGASSESDSKSRVSCPKCVEKNKVCLGECPKAKK